MECVGFELRQPDSRRLLLCAVVFPEQEELDSLILLIKMLVECIPVCLCLAAGQTFPSLMFNTVPCLVPNTFLSYLIFKHRH